MTVSAGKLGRWIGGGVMAAAVQPLSVRACTACFGQSDSAMAAGMNWGIFALLVMIVVMLGGIAGFFVFLARRAAKFGAAAANEATGAQGEEIEDLVPRPLRGEVHESSAFAQRRKDCAPSHVRMGPRSHVNQRRP